MWPNRSDPTKSAYEALQRQFHFQSMPVAPPGRKCLVHIKPNWQQSVGVHGENGFYIKPALKHYCCYKVIIQLTNTSRITDTILPAVSATDCLITAIKQLQEATTKHTVTEAVNEEKAINTCQELLTAKITC